MLGQNEMLYNENVQSVSLCYLSVIKQEIVMHPV